MSGTIDLDAIAEDAAERVAAKLIEVLPALIRAELDRREHDRLLDTTALARYLGKPSTKACSMWLSRPTGAEVAALSVDVGGRRHWRKMDIDAWLGRKP